MDEHEYAELLEIVRETYDYDFRGYRTESLYRRIAQFMEMAGARSPRELIEPLREDPELFDSFVERLCISYSEMFRDPPIYKFLRREIIPRLRSFPRINIWSAGSAHGEEAYSLAILLEEENLYDRARIYATDISKTAIQSSKEGIFNQEQLRKYAENYAAAGGVNSFSDYVHLRYGRGIIKDRIKSRVSFFTHNLTRETSFIEAQLIVCSNVFIYFNEQLQQRLLELFYRSLSPYGFLALGVKERVPDRMLGKYFFPINSNLPVFARAQGS